MELLNIRRPDYRGGNKKHFVFKTPKHHSINIPGEKKKANVDSF